MRTAEAGRGIGRCSSTAPPARGSSACGPANRWTADLAFWNAVAHRPARRCMEIPPRAARLRSRCSRRQAARVRPAPDGAIQICDIRTGQPIGPALKVHVGPVHALNLSRGGDHTNAVGRRRTARSGICSCDRLRREAAYSTAATVRRPGPPPFARMIAKRSSPGTATGRSRSGTSNTPDDSATQHWCRNPQIPAPRGRSPRRTAAGRRRVSLARQPPDAYLGPRRR